MAVITLSFRSIVSGAEIATIDKTVQVTGDGLDLRNIDVPIGADLQIEFLLTLARLKGYYIVSDKALTLQTNTAIGTGTAGQDIALEADKPLVWYEGCGYTSHFTANCTVLYVTNASGAAAVLRLRILKDVTP